MFVYLKNGVAEFKCSFSLLRILKKSKNKRKMWKNNFLKFMEKDLRSIERFKNGLQSLISDIYR